MTAIRADQAQAMGGCVSCQTGTPPPKDPSESGSGGGPPGPSVVTVDSTKQGFIGITLVDTDQRPVPGAAYELELPNGEKISGLLDGNGKVRVEGIDPGNCTVTFPEIDRRDFA